MPGRGRVRTQIVLMKTRSTSQSQSTGGKSAGESRTESPQEKRGSENPGSTGPSGAPGAGTERHEPGKPTRGAPPKADPESEKIAKQQGTSQRGFSDDEGPPPTVPDELQSRH
jgi:hypothetical protein